MSLLRLLFVAAFAVTNATHIAFMTVSWTQQGATTTFNFNWQMALRATFFSPYPVKGATSHNIGNAQYVALPSTQYANRAVILVPVEVYASDDWFIGTTVHAQAVSGTGQQRLFFSQCCRISTLLQSNNDQNGYAYAYMDPRENAGPSSTGLAREYFFLGQPANYVVPAVSPQNRGFKFEIPPAADTGLVTLSPSGSGFALDQVTGRFTWVPTRTGLYAIQVRCTDGNWNGATFTATLNKIPVDFIMQVIAPCNLNDPSCNRPPYLVKDLTCGRLNPVPVDCLLPFEKNFFRGVEGTYQIFGKDDNAQDTVTVINSALPDGAAFYQEVTGNPCTYRFKWTPAIDQVSAIVCFKAKDSRGLFATGNYCVKCNIGNAALIYVSGIIRDFLKAHPDMSKANGDAGRPIVTTTLGADDKPVFNSAAGALTTVTSKATFDQWFNDVANVNKRMVYSLTLSNGTEADGRIFTFLSTVLWPIDNLLWGNEGEAHNNYYTYEVATYMTYYGREKFIFQSSDDLWVYVDRVLPASPAWSLAGVHAVTTYTLDMDTGFPAKPLVTGTTYPCHIFFAHRGKDHSPALQLELPNAVLCNALQSGVTTINLPTFTGTANQRITTWGVAAISGAVLRIMDASAVFNSGSAWYSEQQGAAGQQTWQPIPLKILYGFSTTFNFIYSGVTGGSAEGFAFVLQSQGPGARGGEGANLGYSNIEKSLAFEFDSNTNLNLGDPSYDHVSVHTRYTAPNDPSEIYSLGISAAVPAMTLANGTVHRIRLEYMPARDDKGSTVRKGWLRLWMNDNIAPLMQAIVDGGDLSNTFGAAAYGGFTSGSSDVKRANIDIQNWNLIVVPPSAARSSLVTQPADLTAGNNGVVVVQTRDACGNDIKVGEEAYLFTVTIRLQKGGKINWNSTVTSNHDGTYSITYAPTVAGIYDITILFGEGANAFPILNSPFTLRVVPAATSALTSTYVYGRLPVRPSNALSPEGLWVVQIEPVNGLVVNQRMYDFSVNPDRYGAGGPAAFNTFIGSVPATHIVAMAAVGDIKPLLSNIEVNTAMTFGAKKLGQYVAYGSYAVIGVKGEATATKEEVWPDQATTELVRSFGDTATGFDVTAESAGRDFGSYGRLNVVPHTIYVNAASTSQFTVVARDRFGNKVVSGGDPFNLAFNPDIQASGGTIFPMLYPYSAHYQMSWTSSVAGNYDMFVKLAATNIVRSPVSLKVIPAAADCHTSFATGSGLTVGYATVATYFTLYLNDQYGNLLQQPNPNAPDVVTCSLYGPTTATQKVTIPAVGNWVVVGNAQELRMTYNATKTGLYDLTCVINSCPLDDTVGQQITVFPGQAYAPECVAAGTGIDTGTVVKAGTPTTFTVQSYDAGANLIEIENTYMFTVTYSGPVTDDSIKYDGLGKYLIQYTPTQAAAYTITVKLPAAAVDPNARNIGGGDICKNTGCKTSPFTVVVQAGDASYLSVVQTPLPTPVVAGELNTFNIIAKDKLLNLVTDRAQMSKFLVKMETDPVETLSIFKAESSIAVPTTPPEQYKVTYNCTKAATYTVNVLSTIDGQHLNYLTSGAWTAGQAAPTIVCNPAATSPPQTRIDGDGALGGVFNQWANFTIQARDRFGNNQIHLNDQWSVLLPGYTNGIVTPRPGSKGLYDAAYKVPDCGVKPCQYTLRVMFTTGGQNIQVYQKTDTLSSASALTSYADPIGTTYQTARVGVVQTWQIKDQDSNSQPTAAATTFTVEIKQTVGGNDYYAPNVVVIPAGKNAQNFFLYGVTWTPERTGTFEMTIREKGIFKTLNSPYTVTVTPGLISPPDCKIIGLPATKTAGTINTFTAELYDLKGYRITGADASGYTITATLDAGAGGTVTGVWTSATNVYTFTYNLTVAGSKLANVQQAGARLQQQSFDLIIEPAAVYAPTCTASGSGVTSVIAGSTAFFELTARDRFNNLAAENNIAWVLALADGANPAVTFTSFYKGLSKYSITYVPKKTGTYDLSVRIGATSIAGSPYRPAITPAGISETLTALTTTPGTVVAGDPITFTVATKDVFNNPWKDNVGSQRLIRALVVTPPRGDTVDANVVNRPGGLYDVTLPGTQTHVAGDYSFSLRAEGVEVKPPSMAAPIRVVAGPVDPSQTIVPLALPPTKVSVKITFNVTVCDQYGNPILDGRAAENVQLSFLKGATDCAGETRNLTSDPNANVTSYQPATSFTQDACVPSTCNVRPGVYQFTVSSNKIGIFQLGVIFVRSGNRIPLPCSQRTSLNIEILPGDPDPASSIISGPTAGLAGDNLVYWVEIRDSDDNPIGRSLPAGSFKFGGEAATGTQPPTVLGATGGGVSVTIMDFQNATYRVVAAPTAKGDYAVMASINGVRISGTSSNPFSPVDRVSISPNVAFSFQVPTITNPTAGIPGSFTLQATDKWKNTVTTNGHTYTVRFSRKGSAYTFVAPVTPLTLGQHRVDYMSQWHGDFDISIDLIDQYGVKGDSGFLTVKILHQTCAFDNPGPPVKAIRCPPSGPFPNGECVASFDQCTPPVAVCPVAKPYACADGSCQADASQCNCPSGQVRCPQGNCVTSSTLCPIAQPCPLNAAYKCLDGAGVPTGECRADAAGCPSPVACTPGYVLCPSGVSCARTVAECPALPSCAPGTYACPSGTCVANVQDCPTAKTCTTATDVVCASDGSCQSSADKCPDQYKCYAPNDKRCPDGSCRADLSTCPTPITCPWGYILCQNGQCAPSLSQCLAPFPCGADKVRCADGTCLDNLLLCPSVSICLPATPIKCSDGSCVASSFDCSLPTQCPASGQVCIDGTCIVAGQSCPTRTTCPQSAPILCNDGMCVADTTRCTAVAPCPPAAPHRCPDGACRGTAIDCPSQSVCPAATIPVRCPDGKCVVASDNCVSVTQLNCPNSADVRCPGGECAPTQALCPTHVTCPAGFEKCLDGTCRSVNTCPLDANVFCAAGRVTCPQAGMGVSCADTLAECPTTPLCPADRPVKCMDASCGQSVNDCPTPPTTYDDGKIACPDGSWTKDITQCGTPVTCPPDYPYKCYDDTCRRNPADCPVAGGCPIDNVNFPNNIYLCPNGNCVERLWDAACLSTSIPCSDLSTTPVKCPSGECKSSIQMCPTLDPTCNPQLDPLCLPNQQQPCPNDWTRCRDGSCKADPRNCATMICPSAVPFLCPDGLCTTDQTKCNNANGCPWDKPQPCWNGVCAVTGSCSPLPDPICPGALKYCQHGATCIPDPTCPVVEVDGCEIGFMRCADKSCVRKPAPGRVSECIAGSSDSDGPLANACPFTRPYQCPDGFCALTATLCPVSSTNLPCPADTPFRCADGGCVLMSTSCPLVSPCPNGWVRCGDGSCRETAVFCPIANTCPTDVSYRCSNGLCATGSSTCLDETTGCPGGFAARCPNGACIRTGQTCADVTRPANGCPMASPYRCTDGSCVVAQNMCPNAVGCIAPNVFRCPLDGLCILPTGTCAPAATACASKPFTCADGTCAALPSDCETTNGCKVLTPYRCANGTCVADRNSCPASVSCGQGETLCYNGVCEVSASLCKTAPACAAATPFICPSGDCAANAAACPNTRTCPTATPVLCADGSCRTSPNRCPSTTTNQNNGALGGGVVTSWGDDLGCSAPTPRRCFDGSCRATPLECMEWMATIVAGTTTTLGTPQAVQSVCPTGMTLCADGSCQLNPRWCPIVPRCPKDQIRCANGACVVDIATCPVTNVDTKCPAPYWPCEDGTCRETCLDFNGCPTKSLYRYHCANRECAQNAIDCNNTDRYTRSPRYDSRDYAEAKAAPVNTTRRLLQVDPRGSNPNGCFSNCRAEVQPALLSYSINTRTAVTLPIAVDMSLVTQGRLIVPSGALQTSDGTGISQLTIFPVAESRMRNAVNRVDPSRQDEYGKFMTFPYTLLSPAFECVTESKVLEPFAVNVTYKANIDLQRSPEYLDVCLARLVVQTGVVFRTWECVHGNDVKSRQDNPTRPQGTTAPLTEVTGSFRSCGQGTVYAFVHMPREVVPVKPPEQVNYFTKYVVWILLGLVLGVGLVFGCFYFGKRLHRYREKYHEERAQVDRMQEEVNTMEQFGGRAGTKDEEVALTDNPLVMQMADMQKKLEAKDIEMEEAAIAEREAESGIRQGHITALKDDRNALQEELDRLKAELESQNGLRGQATVAPVRGARKAGDVAAEKAEIEVRKKKKKQREM